VTKKTLVSPVTAGVPLSWGKYAPHNHQLDFSEFLLGKKNKNYVQPLKYAMNIHPGSFQLVMILASLQEGS
jgi:hypothetical protein